MLYSSSLSKYFMTISIKSKGPVIIQVVTAEVLDVGIMAAVFRQLGLLLV